MLVERVHWVPAPVGVGGVRVEGTQNDRESKIVNYVPYMRSAKLVIYGCWRCRWWREIKMFYEEHRNVLFCAYDCRKFVLFVGKIESSGRRTRSFQYISCGLVTGWAAFCVFSRYLFLLGKILEWYFNILRMAQEFHCQHNLRSNIWIMYRLSWWSWLSKAKGLHRQTSHL